MLQLETVLCAGLNDPEAGWNMGSFGAIAEFTMSRVMLYPWPKGLPNSPIAAAYGSSGWRACVPLRMRHSTRAPTAGRKAYPSACPKTRQR